MNFNEDALFRFDIIALCACLGVIILYHAYIITLGLTKPLFTIQGLNNYTRKIWVRIIMKESKSQGINAVQVLRNTIFGIRLE